MKVLLDHDVPYELRLPLTGEHEVVTAQYQGWTDFDDESLMAVAEGQFDASVTLDTNLAHRQNLGSRMLGVVVVDLHPVVPSHLKVSLGKIHSAPAIIEKKPGAVVVREGDIGRLEARSLSSGGLLLRRTSPAQDSTCGRLLSAGSTSTADPGSAHGFLCALRSPVSDPLS